MLDGIIRPTKKPDADNVLKVVADSLNHIAYKDDSQIVDAYVRKFYCEKPRIEVTIRPANSNKSEREVDYAKKAELQKNI